MSKKLIIIGLIIIAAIAAAVFFFWYRSSRGRGVTLDIQAPDQILTGVPFDILINIGNESSGLVKEAKLTVKLPEGVVFAGEPEEKNIFYKELGNLGAQGLTQESIRVIALAGGENTIKRIQASLTYLPFALGARFENKQSFDLIISGSGLPIDIVTPTKIFSGEDFETAISFQNISDYDFSNLKLAIDYPPNFNFLKATAELRNEHREWLLGDLRSGSQNKIRIIGNLVGPDNAIFDFRVNLEMELEGQKYLISSNTATITIAPSPLSLEIILNGDPQYIASADDILFYEIIYRNNTDIGLKDAVIKARLTGEMFNFGTLATNATYRDIDKTLIWNASNEPALAIISPGEEGMVKFKIRTKKIYPIRRLSDKNFTLKLNVEIESPTVPYFVGAKKTMSFLKHETKVAGQIKIDAQAYFRDAASGILNKGPFPPRLNQATNFTIHWLITNFSTDVSDVEVRAFLGPNVRMTEVVKSNIASLPLYNELTQEVVWKIDKIMATKGVISEPVEAIFQIEAVPSVAGDFWPLIQTTQIKAIDDFTGVVLSHSDKEISTLLPDDPTISSWQGKVIE